VGHEGHFVETHLGRAPLIVDPIHSLSGGQLEEVMSRLFGPVRQLGYVTRDAFASMRLLNERAGIGPWYFFESRMAIQFEEQRSDVDVVVAFANSGGLQIELIEQRDDAPTAFREALETFSGLHAVHHQAFWPSDYDRSIDAALRAGLRVLQTIEVPRGRVTYWRGDAPQDLVLELAESTEGRQRTRDLVAAAACGWDGSEPYRRLG
jgi:hypothetical protein